MQSKTDLSLYIKEGDSEKIYLIIYVDDFLIACKNMKNIDEIPKRLGLKFQLTDFGCFRNSRYLSQEKWILYETFQLHRQDRK